MIDNANAKYSMQVLLTDSIGKNISFSTSHISQSKMASGTDDVAEQIDNTILALLRMTTNTYNDTIIIGKGSVQSQIDS